MVLFLCSLLLGGFLVMHTLDVRLFTCCSMISTAPIVSSHVTM